MKNSICKKCSSYGYCANRATGMLACINYNKFPKDKGSYQDYLNKGNHRGKDSTNE